VFDHLPDQVPVDRAANQKMKVTTPSRGVCRSVGFSLRPQAQSRALVASARMESEEVWRAGENLGHARTGSPFRTQAKAYATILALLHFLMPVAEAHHFKGLPHYNYFENYPQVPEEEFIGQVGDYEVSLVVYDFQGIDRKKVETPDNVRLFLVIFNLSDNSVYGGPLTIEVLDGEKVVVRERQKAAELENLYSLYHELPKTGKYSLRLILHDENDLVCTIPFRLSSQIVNWGRWVAVGLGVVLVVTAVGARRARVRQDRSEGARKRREQQERQNREATT